MGHWTGPRLTPKMPGLSSTYRSRVRFGDFILALWMGVLRVAFWGDDELRLLAKERVIRRLVGLIDQGREIAASKEVKQLSRYSF